MPVVQIADVIVPQIFTPYVQQETEVKSRLIQSGAVVRDTELDSALLGGGVTFNSPSFKDLADDADNTGTDDPATLAAPNKLGTSNEIQVRLSRNNSWSSMDLAGDLAGADPMQAIGSRVSSYWARRLQSAFVASIKGVFADNAAAPTAGEHVLNDMTVDVSSTAFSNGVTNFTTGAFIDSCLTMGDSMDQLGMVMVHSVVYGRMLKNDLIDFIPDAVNPAATQIPTFLGRVVIVDDSMPSAAGVFESWLFGAGAVRLGMGSPKVPTEVSRIAAAGNGSGQDVLHNRTEWIISPAGVAYAGTSPAGGPTNAATANNLAHAGSWKRAFPERKQVKIARLVTREF